MIKHLFKLIWNKKGKNFLLMTEIFISFMVLFAVFSFIVYYYNNYTYPMGFKYDNVWTLSFTQDQHFPDSLGVHQESYRQLLKSMPEVEAFSFCSNNTPFSMSNSNTEVTYNKTSSMTNFYEAEDDYSKTLGIPLLEGRWFNASDAGGKYKPVVINTLVKEKLFGNKRAIGEIVTSDKDQYKVVGVVGIFKDKGNFQSPEGDMFRRIDSLQGSFVSSMLVKVKSGVGTDFEGKLWKQLNAVNPQLSVEIEHLTDKRIDKNKLTWVPMLIMLIVGGFLVFNVSLGIFGVLWYNINRRRDEVGLRRAVGATGGDISWQFIGEALVIATFGLLLGCFLALQFPLMHVFDIAAGVYLIAIVLSILAIYLLVVACSLYPARQAAEILPAVALHDE